MEETRTLKATRSFNCCRQISSFHTYAIYKNVSIVGLRLRMEVPGQWEWFHFVYLCPLGRDPALRKCLINTCGLTGWLEERAPEWILSMGAAIWVGSPSVKGVQKTNEAKAGKTGWGCFPLRGKGEALPLTEEGSHLVCSVLKESSFESRVQNRLEAGRPLRTLRQWARRVMREGQGHQGRNGKEAERAQGKKPGQRPPQEVQRRLSMQKVPSPPTTQHRGRTKRTEGGWAFLMSPAHLLSNHLDNVPDHILMRKAKKTSLCVISPAQGSLRNKRAVDTEVGAGQEPNIMAARTVGSISLPKDGKRARTESLSRSRSQAILGAWRGPNDSSRLQT